MTAAGAHHIVLMIILSYRMWTFSLPSLTNEAYFWNIRQHQFSFYVFTRSDRKTFWWCWMNEEKRCHKTKTKTLQVDIPWNIRSSLTMPSLIQADPWLRYKKKKVVFSTKLRSKILVERNNQDYVLVMAPIKDTEGENNNLDRLIQNLLRLSHPNLIAVGTNKSNLLYFRHLGNRSHTTSSFFPAESAGFGGLPVERQMLLDHGGLDEGGAPWFRRLMHGRKGDRKDRIQTLFRYPYHGEFIPFQRYWLCWRAPTLNNSTFGFLTTHQV